MSWSKNTQGTPEEVGNAIRHAILQSVHYNPPSARRLRTGEIVADATRKTIVDTTAHDTGLAKPPQIVASSAGHINDDGSISWASTSVTFVPEVLQTTQAETETQESPTANGPDAVTASEVDAVLEGAGIPQVPAGSAATSEEVRTDEIAAASEAPAVGG